MFKVVLHMQLCSLNNILLQMMKLNPSLMSLKIFNVTLKKVNLNLKLLSKIFILILNTSLFNVLAKLVENCILVVVVMIKLPQICICILKNKFNTLLNL
ncbi:Uncharacterised protein [Mycobacteroides abscessus subsp. massiliense]|nr:Uncharacterised protein [Mycobacteroides abscessus subsp. massiliense]